MKQINSLLAAALIGVSLAAGAHEGENHRKKAGPVTKEQKDWGIAGEAKAVKRTIDIVMTDDMRFTPDRIEVKRGETIRFVHKNAGKIMHEFVIGTKKDLDEHAAMMAKFPGHGARRALHGACGAGKDKRDCLDVQSPGRVRLRLPDRRPLPGRNDREDQCCPGRRWTG